MFQLRIKYVSLNVLQVAYLISIDSFVIYKKEFTELIESEVVVLGENEVKFFMLFFFNCFKLLLKFKKKKVYENEELYEDFAVVIREHIYSQNSSLLFEVIFIYPKQIWH